MKEVGSAQAVSANVIRDFARSELFDRTFREGMELVEAAAAYLDGPGRQESKLLSRNAALAYAAESMRLTTRLMQVASWLLVQRAVREGDMTAQEACDPRYRIGAQPAPRRANPLQVILDGETGERLPDGLMDLITRSERVFDRINHLDERMYADGETEDRPNPVLSQFERLRAAFDGPAN
jgi:regulator of CtrA degradation